MILVFSPAKVQTEWGFCAIDLVSTLASWFHCGHKVCGVIMCSLLTSVMGELGHGLDLARLSNWSCSYKNWVPLLSMDALSTVLNGSLYMDQLTGFWIKGVPLACFDWMASCVSDRESGVVKNDTHRCVWFNFVDVERLVAHVCLTLSESTCLAKGKFVLCSEDLL